MSAIESKLKLEETDSDGITYSYLPSDMYHILAPIFAQFNAQLPEPAFSRIAIAMTADNEIAGFYCLQMMAHAEPMWVNPKYRGSRVWLRLAEIIDANRRGTKTYIIAENDESAKMCEMLGMEKVMFPVYVRKD